jgi:hypothetical protein
MATREELKDKRGLMVSVIMDDSRLRKVWAPEMADWTDDNDVTRNFWVEDSVTRVLAMGHVTTVPQFRLRFNKWMENPPKRFSIPQLLLLEHAMGVPSHEWERLPVYDQKNPHPANMSDVDAGRANAKQTAAWSQFCRETDKHTIHFGDDDMLSEFESKKDGVTLAPSPEGLPPAIDGVRRHVFSQAQFSGLVELIKNLPLGVAAVQMIDDSNNSVVDMVPEEMREAYAEHVAAFEKRDEQ